MRHLISSPILLWLNSRILRVLVPFSQEQMDLPTAGPILSKEGEGGKVGSGLGLQEEKHKIRKKNAKSGRKMQKIPIMVSLEDDQTLVQLQHLAHADHASSPDTIEREI